MNNPHLLNFSISCVQNSGFPGRGGEITSRLSSVPHYQKAILFSIISQIGTRKSCCSLTSRAARDIPAGCVQTVACRQGSRNRNLDHRELYGTWQWLFLRTCRKQDR